MQALTLLDLLGVDCPINFVKTKLKLDSMRMGDILEVLLDNGEPVESVSASIVAEGHKILSKTQTEDGAWSLFIEKSV